MWLKKIIQTQSVWQGDANKALASAPEDSSSTNDWLSYSDTLSNNVTFTPVNSNKEKKFDTFKVFIIKF